MHQLIGMGCGMSWEAWFTFFVVLGVFAALVRNLAPTDAVLMVALTLLVVVRELTGTKLLPSAVDAVVNLGNSGLVTVGALFVVVAGLVQTGTTSLIAAPLLGRPKSSLQAQARLMLPVAFISSFLNNTPVVAMFMPVVDDVAKRTRISPSRLYLPMAYAASFGGICTLVGTSTNMIVNGLLIDRTGSGLSMFDLTWVGLPCALAAIAFVLATSRLLLPDRKPAITLHDDPRQYTVEMLVQDGGPLVGKQVDEAGLRHLPGLFLVEIERQSEIITAVSSRQQLHAADRLVFVGVLESVVDLQNIRGLSRAPEAASPLATAHAHRRLIEAVVSDRCPLVGTTIREGQFRTMYNAAVLAVARGSERVAGKIGDIVLQSGDTLLLETDEDFVRRQRNSSHFYLISGVDSQLIRHDRAWVALIILVGMIVVATAGWIDLLSAAMLAAVMMVLTQCCSLVQARQSIDWSLLVAIAASLGIGRALEASGLANIAATKIIGLAGSEPWLVLLAVYAVTMIFTELITNNAAAVLAFPIAMASADKLQVNTMPFVIAVCIAASAGFATPFGYQTNLMVYSPGGYRFTDYLRVGVPLDLLFLAITVSLAPHVWPF
jgi:di/tricarboxylate transporter